MLDGTTAAALIQDVHNSPAVTLLDYNDEESLTYCVMTGLLWSTLGKYISLREEQAGKGRADLIYEPAIKGTAPLILIEFKYDCSAEEAIAQIKTQEYFKRITDPIISLLGSRIPSLKSLEYKDFKSKKFAIC